jgi:hypothetical protein
VRGWICALLLAWSLIQSPPAAAGQPGVKLVVSPPNLVFRVNSPLVPGATALADLHVQVLVPPRQSWRLTVLTLGPVVSAEGAQIAANQISWRGSPGSVFLDGVLRPGSPQLCGQGSGPTAGLLHFIVQPTQDTNAGNYNQKLLFSLSSP